MDAKQINIIVIVCECFNPRARDGRELVTLYWVSYRDVSIHAPVMDANCAQYDYPKRPSFNPRARDGREECLMTSIYELTVSIHAPVMDAKLKKLKLKP